MYWLSYGTRTQQKETRGGQEGKEKKSATCCLVSLPSLSPAMGFKKTILVGKETVSALTGSTWPSWLLSAQMR